MSRGGRGGCPKGCSATAATGPLAPRDAPPVLGGERAVVHHRVGWLERVVDAVRLQRQRFGRAAFGAT